MNTVIFLTLAFVLSIECKTYDVSTAAELDAALKAVNPGDTISLKNGTYSGKFVTERSGTSSSPITIKGSEGAVLTSTSYGFWLKANYWNVEGFSVSGALKGVVLEGASHNVLDGLHVRDIQQEGIHFRLSSSNNILRNSNIHDTGKGGDPGIGEGVYIGQAVSNWANGKQDKSDNNQVLNNKIGPSVTAECIDIKEGSCCGIIKGNTFDGTGESDINSADSWVDVKGDSYTIEDNTGTNSIKDGFQIHHIAAAGMGGCDNIIEHNHCSKLGSGGKCVVNASKGCTNTIEDNE